MNLLHRVLRRLTGEDTARANAEAATAELRQRRHESDDVASYLLDLNRARSGEPEDARFPTTAR